MISGAEQGHIWIDEMVNDGGYFPLTVGDAPETRVAFLTWYENWLDHSLRRATAGDKTASSTYFEFGSRPAE